MACIRNISGKLMLSEGPSDFFIRYHPFISFLDDRENPNAVHFLLSSEISLRSPLHFTAFSEVYGALPKVFMLRLKLRNNVILVNRYFIIQWILDLLRSMLTALSSHSLPCL